MRFVKKILLGITLSTLGAGFVLMATSFDTALAASELRGDVRLDGSSTVFPISEAVAEEFQKKHPRVHVTVGISGTGGGFKKFCVGEIDISDASRPIKPTEKALALENSLEYIELPIAYDGLSVLINPANEFADELSIADLKRIWERDSGVTNWSDVREGWPQRKIKLYGPGTDSGTFDYFVEAVLGKDGSVRPDFTASEDDNVLVQGIAGDKDALGFFGFAYYAENKERLKLVAIDGDHGPVKPSEETINDGTYAPLSRPLLIYVSTIAAQRPEVDEFVRFYLENAGQLAGEVGYVALSADDYMEAQTRYRERKTGSTAISSASDSESRQAVLAAAGLD